MSTRAIDWLLHRISHHPSRARTPHPRASSLRFLSYDRLQFTHHTLPPPSTHVCDACAAVFSRA